MTVIIKTQEELEALVDHNNNIIIYDDLEINCNIKINANINAYNIKAYGNINANYIKARDINVQDIKAWDIKADDIKADDIKAYDIKAYDIKAYDIKAYYINAYYINAKNIRYYSFCIARKSLICETIEGRRQNAVHLCLDQPIQYIK